MSWAQSGKLPCGSQTASRLQHSVLNCRDKSHSSKDAAYLPLADSHLQIDWLGEGLARRGECSSI